MKNKRGFSLAELIFSMTIIAVAISMMSPGFYRQVGKAQQIVCDLNCLQFMRSFKVFKAFDTEGYTLEEAINIDTCPPELRDEVERLKRFEGGTYSVVDGQLVCSARGVVGSCEDSCGKLAAGDTVFGHILLSDWEDLCDSVVRMPWGGVRLNAGTVYVLNGYTYVVAKDSYLSQEAAAEAGDDPGSLAFVQQFDPGSAISTSSYNRTVGWFPLLKNGDVCSKNGVVYVFYGEDDTQWEPLPDRGGNWVMLTGQNNPTPIKP